jgi:hypothetical protein
MWVFYKKKTFAMMKICPRCKSRFECRLDEILNCHCLTVGLDARQLAYLSEHYDDCLCNACLRDVRDNFYAVAPQPGQ